MDEDQLFLRPAKPPPAGISEDAYRISDDLDFIKLQLSHLWADVRRAAMLGMLGMIGGAAAAVTLIETFAR
jgi:hypothetical protein